MKIERIVTWKSFKSQGPSLYAAISVRVIDVTRYSGIYSTPTALYHCRRFNHKAPATVIACNYRPAALLPFSQTQGDTIISANGLLYVYKLSHKKMSKVSSSFIACMCIF